jgi:hypothetical protein
MKILINEDIPLALWDDLVEKNEHSTPFQTPGFYRFINLVKDTSADRYLIRFLRPWQ